MTEGNDTEHLSLYFECDAAQETVWEIGSASFTEKLSEPYLLMLQLATKDMQAAPIRLLGQSASFKYVRGSFVRTITGIVSEVQEGSTDTLQVTTNITVEPAFEALKHRRNTRIFQEKTVPEILEAVINEDLGDYDRTTELKLSRTYPTCDYRVQYDESDFSFCERLMEEEGIVYWFDFSGDAEKLVLADDDGSYSKIESIHDGVCQYSKFEGGVGGHEYVSELSVASGVVSTKLTTRHFDWNGPSTPVEGDSSASDSGGGDMPNGAYVDPGREVYEHDTRPLTSGPGGTTYGSDKDDIVKIRREEQACLARFAEGTSTITAMKPGAIFDLVGHPIAALDSGYLVLEVMHSITVSGLSYRNTFRCIPEDVPFRPVRGTPKPRICSIQTATVVGPSGEEIHTDEHGRIKVQFHWDRLGANDDHSSCWMRVMQPWAGAGWGFVFIPRIGMEVIVEFVNGDPDLPMIVGSLYNGDNPPPYSLPDEKTKSTIKTNSSLGGDGYNELRFEDKAGSEEIFTHAQKDLNEVVENDHNTLVHHDQTNTVDNDQTQEIGNDQTEHIGNNQDMTVDANRTTHIKGDFSETVDGSETRVVSTGVTEHIDSGETRTISGGMTETINGNRDQTINSNSTETITGALDQTIVGGAKIETPATYNITAVGGFKVTAPAGSQIQATGGYTLIAPGGNTTHDWNFGQTGMTWTDNFFMTLSFSTLKIDGCAATALSANGIAFDKKGVEMASGILQWGFIGNENCTFGVELMNEVLGADTDGADVDL